MIFKIIHFCCYIISLVFSVIFAYSIDYSKFIKARNNKFYYVAFIVITASSTYLLANCLYGLITVLAIEE